MGKVMCKVKTQSREWTEIYQRLLNGSPMKHRAKVVTRERGLDDVQFLWWGVAVGPRRYGSSASRCPGMARRFSGRNGASRIVHLV
jgi:hypothetical protein